MTVLILTHQFDTEADLVIQELATRGVPVFRCDASEFPQRLTLSADLRAGWTGSLRTEQREVALESIGAAYYRKPSRFRFVEGMSATERRFAAAEARLGFGGVLASLPCRWVNHPHRIAAAEYKPLQLRVAAECGLRVPRTLITNAREPSRPACPTGWCTNRCPTALEGSTASRLRSTQPLCRRKTLATRASPGPRTCSRSGSPSGARRG